MNSFGEIATDIAQKLATAPAAAAGIWASDTLIPRNGGGGDVVRDHAGHDLYGGSAGIAWFLAHEARWLGSATRKAVARAGLEAAMAGSDAMLRRGQLSLYGGAAGIALAVEEGGRALDDPALCDAAATLIQKIALAADAAPPAEADLIAGKAGILVALLAFGARLGATSALRRAIRGLGEQLVEEASIGWWGAAWPEEGEQGLCEQGQSEQGLCGLGHGASGIGWALIEAGMYLGDDRLCETGRAALRYEASRFNRSRGSWPDLRGIAAGRAEGWMDAWCHGAIGIGAVRWRMWDTLREPQLLAQAMAAMAAMRNRVVETMRAPPEQKIDVTLCHGLGGAVELMLLAHEITGRTEHLAAARKVGKLILRLREEHGGRWAVGLAGGRDVPGLFLGQAGIGTMLLRLEAPGAISSPMLPRLSSHRQSGSISRAISLGMANAF